MEDRCRKCILEGSNAIVCESIRLRNALEELYKSIPILRKFYTPCQCNFFEEKGEKETMKDVDEMIERLLDMDIVGEDESIVFTEEAKLLIHEISEECMRASMIVKNKDRMDEYGKGMSAEDVYVDMLHKIVNAPTRLHMRMSARMLISVIDQKLREGEEAIE